MIVGLFAGRGLDQRQLLERVAVVLDNLYQGCSRQFAAAGKEYFGARRLHQADDASVTQRVQRLADSVQDFVALWVQYTLFQISEHESIRHAQAFQLVAHVSTA